MKRLVFVLLLLFGLPFVLLTFSNRVYAGGCDPALFDSTKAYSKSGCNPGDCPNGPGNNSLIVCWPSKTLTTLACCPSNYSYLPDKKLCAKTTTLHIGEDFIPWQCDSNIYDGCKDTKCKLKTKDLSCPSNLPIPNSSNGGLCCPSYNAPLDKCKPIKDVGYCTSDRGIIYEKEGGVCKAVKSTDIYLCTAGATCSTALGPVPTDPSEFISFLLKLALPLAGVIVLLAILYIGYLVLTSQGNPEKLQAARELAISVVTGVLLLIFSFTLLKIIGVNLLALPGVT